MKRMRAGAIAVGLVLGLLAAPGCAKRRDIIDPAYVRVAEGLTSPTLSEGIAVAPRMLSAPQLVDERLPLNTLAIVAVNAANEAMVPPIPIAIEALDTVPPVLQLRSDDPDLNAARIYPLNLGTFRLRISTMCGISPVPLLIDGSVTP